ncbi:apolipoprotein N-acyltransferase [Desulfolithobacter sp.]
MAPSSSPVRLAGSALATAALLSLAMPGGVGAWVLLFVAFIPLLSISLNQAPRRAGFYGLIGGLVYHLVLLYWIVIVLGRYGGLPLWVAVPVLLVLALYMALYWGLFCLLLSFFAGRHFYRERPLSTMVWMAPLLWIGLEYGRGLLFTGFPWMDIGYGLAGQAGLIQAADLGGHYLVGFWLMLANSLIFYFVHRQRPGVEWNRRREQRVMMGLCCFFVFVAGYSLLRYRILAPLVDRSLQARITVVQGNISQDRKWTPSFKTATVAAYERLSRQALAEHTSELVVWPETALPFYPQDDPLAARLYDFTRRENAWLLTGAPTYRRLAGQGTDGRNRVAFFNSALLISPSGIVAGRYDKQHLVPFGEYVPLKKFLPFLEPVVESVGDFSPGSSQEPLAVGDMKIGVLICFESIFPELARQEVLRGANILVNLTNDAWYGRSSAPHQTFAMAIFRAVENRRSLVRTANTGISCFVDPLGNVLARTGLFEAAALTGNVPMYEGHTFFTRSGYRFGAVCLAMIPTLLLFWRRR